MPLRRRRFRPIQNALDFMHEVYLGFAAFCILIMLYLLSLIFRNIRRG